LGKRLRQTNYTQAIVLPNSFKSALIPYFARIPHRTGWLGEWRWGLLNDIRYLNRLALPLMVKRFMSLGLAADEPLPNPIPVPQLITSPAQSAAVALKFGLDKDAAPLLMLCPGAEYGVAKRWPVAHFAQVARKKLALGWEVLIVGSSKDAALGAAIQDLAGKGCHDLTGKTTLAEAIDLMALAQAVVCNDSGLMHIAAALNKPLVAVYGSSSADFTPPLSQHAQILSLKLPCSPCFKRECPYGHTNCLNELKPERVLQALDGLTSP
jgi:heptosyltransferase-2